MTLTQIYEWESMISIIEEQKGDTIEETLDKWDNKDKTKRFRKKEKFLRLLYWIHILIYTGVTYLSVYFEWLAEYTKSNTIT